MQTEADLINAGWGVEVTATNTLGPPSGVAAPSGWFSDALGGNATASGVRVNSWTALTTNPLAAAVKILSEDIAKLPIRIYRHDDKTGGRTVMRDHAIARLLGRKPNRWMTPYVFKSYLLNQYLTNGNAIALISRDATGRPTELLPVDSGRVTPYQIDGDLFYYVSFTTELTRLKYRSAGEWFAAEDVLHVMWPINWQGLWGYSPITLGRETIANAMVLSKYTGNLFANYADVGGVLEHPGRLGDDALQRLRKQWESRHAGEGNRGRTAILEEGMKFSKLSMTAVDAEHIANQKFSVEEVCRMYRIPPYKMMDLTRTIQSNIEEQSNSYVDDTLVPIMQNFEDAYTDKLMVAREPFYLEVEHDVSAFVRGRPSERWDYYTKAILHGVMTPNEVRILEGMNPVEDGDDYYRSNNMVPRDEPIEAPAAPAAAPEPAMTETQQALLEDVRRELFRGVPAAPVVSLERVNGYHA